MTVKRNEPPKFAPLAGNAARARAQLWRPADAYVPTPPLEVLRNALTTALCDQYRSRATYRRILEQFEATGPFSNAVDAEDRHVRELMDLFIAHGLAVPSDPWDDPSGDLRDFATVTDACAAAVVGERETVEMYDRLLALELPGNVKSVLRKLQDASRSNHLPAFQRCVSRGRGMLR